MKNSVDIRTITNCNKTFEIFFSTSASLHVKSNLLDALKHKLNTVINIKSLLFSFLTENFSMK